MFDLNEFAKEVHENAVAHGWWETDRPIYETLALIHSEWSEALEEYRAGRPMVWHACEAPDDIECCVNDGGRVCKRPVCDFCMAHDYQNPKPEGIAVELIDGCIRILDLVGRYEAKISLSPFKLEQESLTNLIADLHLYTSCVYSYVQGGILRGSWTNLLGNAVYECFRFIESQGIDPYELMKTKHEYNKHRPYKHGKVC